MYFKSLFKRRGFEKTPGIVLIDEIDLSLHPTWQRRIVGILKEFFPRIQFICATHSPFIIQSLEEGELITLDQPLDSEYSGEGLEDIAEDIIKKIWQVFVSIKLEERK